MTGLGALRPITETEAQMGTGATLKYDRTTVSLHWITALFVAALWLIGQTADRLPKGPRARPIGRRMS